MIVVHVGAHRDDGEENYQGYGYGYAGTKPYVTYGGRILLFGWTRVRGVERRMKSPRRIQHVRH